MISKENVLIVHNYYQIPGGEDSVVKNEMELLREHGHKIILYSRDNKEMQRFGIFRKLCIPIITIFNPRTFFDIRRLIKNENINIIHIHNTVNLISPAVYYAAVSMKTPIVQTVHNFRFVCPGAMLYRDGHICKECIDKGLSCALLHKCYRNSFLQTLGIVCTMVLHRCTGIYRKIVYICLTDFNKEILLSNKQIRSEQVYVKPNFVNCRVEVNNSILRNHYVYAGRLERIKGVEIMVKAWEILGNDFPDLQVYGEGPLEKWCQEYITNHGIKNIKLFGFRPNHEVVDTISKAIALVFPTQLYEGFPVSIVEAFSTGTPVVCTDIGNAASIVKEGVCGAKFQHDSPEDLAVAIRRLTTYKGIYETTLHEFNEYYNKEKNYSTMQSIYSDSKRKH